MKTEFDGFVSGMVLEFLFELTAVNALFNITDQQMSTVMGTNKK